MTLIDSDGAVPEDNSQEAVSNTVLTAHTQGGGDGICQSGQDGAHLAVPLRHVHPQVSGIIPLLRLKLGCFASHSAE